jgi:coproporphyrinogen III oxidase-like Fe-S oxidoreductase
MNLKIEKAYLMTDEERVRRLLVLNLYSFDLDVVHAKFGNQFDHLFINTLNALIEHGLIKKERHVYSLTHEGIKYSSMSLLMFIREFERS